MGGGRGGGAEGGNPGGKICLARKYPEEKYVSGEPGHRSAGIRDFVDISQLDSLSCVCVRSLSFQRKLNLL